MTSSRWWCLLALIVLLSLARVATTHRVFSQTIDEGSHLIAGYDVLTKRVFSTDRMHPPLARMLFALPFVNEPEPKALPRDHELLLRDDRYTQNLARMRMGNLFFLAIGIIAVGLWARRLMSPQAGLLAAVLYASLPPVLAHAGLATTDMAAAATLAFALYALDEVLRRREVGDSDRLQDRLRPVVVLAVAIALGLLSKYSFVLNFPACALVLVVLRRRFPWKDLVAAAVIAFALTAVVMPPQEYIAGVLEVRRLDSTPPAGYLFGERRQGGWWYYFPVALFYKTPIAFLVLALAGIRRMSAAAIVAAVILAIAMTSNINIGVRHVLPIFGPLAVVAASVRIRWLVLPMTAWLVIGSALAHPDYLPWFNAFAGKEPYRVLNDSNLDWGQDVLRLARLARRENIPAITTSVASFAPLDRIGLPPRKDLQAFQPVHGWVALSEFHIALGRDVSPELRKWIDDLLANRPYRRVGASIRLYHFE